MDPIQKLPSSENEPQPAPSSPVPVENTPPADVNAITPTSPEQPQISSPQASQTPVVAHISRPSRKKRWLLFGLITLLVLVVGGFVFGYYLPNKPNNAYNTGINRTGYALDKLIQGVTDKSSLNSLKKSDITLGIDAQYNGTSYSGTFNAKFDASKANAGLNFTSTNNGQTKPLFNAKLIGELPSGSQYPNIYAQLNGLKSLDIDAYVPGASKYDGQWIAVMSDYLKSLGNVPTADQTAKKQISSDDIAELSRAAVSVSRDYVFSTDPGRALFEKKSFVGKEKVDNLTTYHYTVTLNKDHASAYCQAMVDKIFATNAYKKLPWVNENNIEKDKESSKKDCQTSSNNMNVNDSYDLWVEAKYKLIYKYRVTDGDNKEAYKEIGQIYKGGSKFTFFANYHNGKSNFDSKSSWDIDFNANSTKGTITLTGGPAGSKYSVKLSLDAKPFTGEINSDKPANTVPVDEVLKTFGIDPHDFFGAFSGFNSSSAANTERQTDIKVIHGQVEAYYAQNGYYPTLSDLNSTSWRSTNMKGIDKEALRDPSGSGYTLVAKPAANVYSYEVSAADGSACNNTTKDCAVYTLTATYEGGGTFTKTNLN